MSSFWQERNLIHCAGPPGVPPGTDGFVPNCFAGMASRRSLVATRYPMIALGTVDFSIEFWHRMSALDGGAGTDDADVGFWRVPTTAANAAFGATWYVYPGDTWERAIYRTIVPALTADEAAPAITRWHHHVVNFDRTGNLMIWRDAVDVGVIVDAINAVNIGTMAFAPWVGADNDGGIGWDEWHDTDLTEFDFKHFNGIIGPVAVHTGAGSIMDAAEMRDSMERRYVSLNANTQLLIDWRQPREVQGWDGNRDNIIRGISDYATVPIAAPEGVDGTIIVPDLSGNGNDWILTTREEYDTTVPAVITDFTVTGLSCCAFASDPFFQHGGIA